MIRGPRSKIVRIRRGFLGMGERRRQQRTMNRMSRRYAIRQHRERNESGSHTPWDEELWGFLDEEPAESP